MEHLFYGAPFIQQMTTHRVFISVEHCSLCRHYNSVQNWQKSLLSRGLHSCEERRTDDKIDLVMCCHLDSTNNAVQDLRKTWAGNEWMRGHHHSRAWFFAQVCINSFDRVNNRRQPLKNFECKVTWGKCNSQSRAKDRGKIDATGTS